MTPSDAGRTLCCGAAKTCCPLCVAPQIDFTLNTTCYNTGTVEPTFCPDDSLCTIPYDEPRPAPPGFAVNFSQSWAWGDETVEVLRSLTECYEGTYCGWGAQLADPDLLCPEVRHATSGLRLLWQVTVVVSALLCSRTIAPTRLCWLPRHAPSMARTSPRPHPSRTAQLAHCGTLNVPRDTGAPRQPKQVGFRFPFARTRTHTWALWTFSILPCLQSSVLRAHTARKAPRFGRCVHGASTAPTPLLH